LDEIFNSESFSKSGLRSEEVSMENALDASDLSTHKLKHEYEELTLQ